MNLVMVPLILFSLLLVGGLFGKKKLLEKLAQQGGAGGGNMMVEMCQILFQPQNLLRLKQFLDKETPMKEENGQQVPDTAALFQEATTVSQTMLTNVQQMLQYLELYPQMKATATPAPAAPPGMPGAAPMAAPVPGAMPGAPNPYAPP